MKQIQILMSKLICIIMTCATVSILTSGCMKAQKDVEIKTEEVTTASDPTDIGFGRSPSFKFSETGIGEVTLLTNKVEEDLSGECESGSKVEIKYGSSIETVDCSSSNKWSYTLDSLNQEGETQINITQINAEERTEAIVRKIQLDQSAPRLEKVEGGNVVKDGNTVAKVTLAIVGAGANDKKVKIKIYDDSNCNGKFTLKTVDIKNDKIKFNLAKLGNTQSLNKYLKLKDRAGNESNCLTVTVSLSAPGGTAGGAAEKSGSPITQINSQEVSNSTVQVGVVHQNGSFEESDLINDLDKVKVKLDAKNAKYYGIYNSLQACQSANANSLSKDFTKGIVAPFPVQGYISKAGSKIIAYAKFANENQEMSECVSSQGTEILFDNKIPAASVISKHIEIGPIPFGEQKFPDVRIKQIIQNPQDFEKIDHYLISIKEFSESAPAIEVANCDKNVQIDSNDDGGVLTSNVPSFGVNCTLVVGKKYAYSIIAVDRAGNQSKEALSKKWIPRSCPSEIGNISKDSFLAINVGSDPFCVSKFESKKSESNLMVHPGGVTGISVWTNVSYNKAEKKCKDLGTYYSLINNDQWMTIARLIVKESENWIPQGSSKSIPTDFNARLSAARLIRGYVSKSSVSEDNPINDVNSGIESRKFKLLGDQFIYDFSGNAAEWIMNGSDSEEILAAHYLFQYRGDSSNKHPYREFYPQSLSGILNEPLLAASIKFFKLGSLITSCAYANCGFGKVDLTKISGVNQKNFANYALVRGGRINKVNPTEDQDLGIFAVELRDKDNGNEFIGFRCVYKDQPFVTQ